MRVAIASDHAGLEMKTDLANLLAEQRLDFDDLGPSTATSVDYPDYAKKVADAVATGSATVGVLICGTGIGMSISANKVAGIRAAVCRTEFEARMARAHNDANVLCLGQRVTGSGLARSVLEEFLNGKFEAGRHAKRIDKIIVQDKSR